MIGILPNHEILLSTVTFIIGTTDPLTLIKFAKNHMTLKNIFLCASVSVVLLAVNCFISQNDSFSQDFSQNSTDSEIAIRLEIFCDGPLQASEAQQWGRELNSLGFEGVRIRSGDSSDALDVQPLGGNAYRVSGMLMTNSQILLPGNARFSLSRIREMKPYLEEQILALRQAETDAAAGEAAQGNHDELFQDLAVPVGFRTQGLSRKKVLQKLAGSFESHVRFPSSIRKVFEDSDLVTEELQDVARGTALVYVLRYLGYCVVPEPSDSGNGFTLKIVASNQADAQRILPVGYAVESATPDALYERFQANVDGASAATVLDSLQKRLKIPFLYDFNSMAGLGIEPADVIIRQKSGKFSYKQLLDAVLYQTQLQREVRTDEAGHVFFWLTTIKSANDSKNP